MTDNDWIYVKCKRIKVGTKARYYHSNTFSYLEFRRAHYRKGERFQVFPTIYGLYKSVDGGMYYVKKWLEFLPPKQMFNFDDD